MAEMHAYIVSLTWEGGIGSVQPLVAATPAHAGAIAVANSLRQSDAPTGPLVGVMHTEIPLEWLRWAIRSIESGSTEAAPILTLVPKTPALEPGMTISNPGGPLDGWVIADADGDPPGAA